MPDNEDAERVAQWVARCRAAAAAGGTPAGMFEDAVRTMRAAGLALPERIARQVRAELARDGEPGPPSERSYGRPGARW